MNKSVVVVAGGKGLRMDHDKPKQFIPLKGLPILMRTILNFYNYDNTIRIIVVLSPSYRLYWSELCDTYGFKIPHYIVEGGETRFHSVKNGLALVDEGVVAIHDAARPFVTESLISTSFAEASKHTSAIPVIDVTDSIRYVDEIENSSKIVDRTKYKLVQTPQVFKVSLIKKAYETEYVDSFTDDASVLEYAGGKVHLIKGEKENVKITTPFDLKLANILIEN